MMEIVALLHSLALVNLLLQCLMELLLILRRLISSPQNIQLLFDLYAGEINEAFGFG
mgnify:CR=1 FL=1